MVKKKIMVVFTT